MNGDAVEVIREIDGLYLLFLLFFPFLVGSFYYGLATRNTEQQWWYLVVFRCLFGDFE